MNKYTPEHLATLQQDYNFISKSIGFFRENYNFYGRANGLDNLLAVMANMEAEKLKLAIQIDFLTDYLKN